MLVGDDPNSTGGIATHLQLLREHVASWANVDVYAVGSAGRTETSRTRAARRVAEPLRFYRRLRSARPSIVHLNCSFDQKSLTRDVALAWVALASGAKVVLQVHGGGTDEVLRSSRAARLLTYAALRAARRVVFLTRAQLEPVAKLYPAYARNLRVIPNMAPAMEFVRDEFRPAAARRSVLFLSRILREKGIFDLIQAVALLTNRGVNLGVFVAGDGPDRRAAAALTVELDLTEQIQFVGYIRGADKANLLSSATALVLPTYYAEEGTPYALLEAMQAGLPIITCRTAGIVEILDDESALFVPPRDPGALADAIEQLLSDPALQQRLRQAAARQARERFAPAAIVERWTRLYQELSD
jgi:glycosyltransferase involved in cell wall biosynthesis